MKQGEGLILPIQFDGFKKPTFEEAFARLIVALPTMELAANVCRREGGNPEIGFFVTTPSGENKISARMAADHYLADLRCILETVGERTAGIEKPKSSLYLPGK